MKQYTRRTPEQWQTLVSQWRNSGQSAARFCETHGIGYASFCQWRKRLTDETAPAAESSRAERAPFIDLDTLASLGQGSGWSIVLSLGDGIELRLSRP